MTLGIPFPDPRPRIYRISPTRRWFDDSKTEPGSRCSWQPPPSRWWTQHKTSCPWFQWTPRMPGNWWHLKVWVSDEHWSNMMKHKKLSRLECKVKRVNKQQDKKGCSAHTHTQLLGWYMRIHCLYSIHLSTCIVYMHFIYQNKWQFEQSHGTDSNQACSDASRRNGRRDVNGTFVLARLTLCHKVLHLSTACKKHPMKPLRSFLCWQFTASKSSQASLLSQRWL